MPLPQSLYVPLPADTAEALRDLAVREYRHPKAQAAFLITEALRLRGALPPVDSRAADPNVGAAKETASA